MIEFSDLSEMPDIMVLPAQSGVTVSLGCGPGAFIQVHCVPEKFDQGKLVCTLDQSQPRISARRIQRSLDENKPKLSILTDFNENVRPILSKMAPEIFGCTTSIAGCDFCFYYLATYNLSVAPAACVGGCSLGAFGACSKLIPSSILKTFDLQ